jgi:hypothetical protein
VAGVRPTPVDFVRRWLETHDSFRADGERGPYRRAAERLAAADPSLVIEDDPSVVAGHRLAGWRLRRKHP